MARSLTSAFAPDYAIPPGETLQETLDTLGLSQAQLAERTGRPKKTINEIINAKAAIMPDTALQFERVLGVPAAFWLTLEQDYQSALARRAERARLAEQVEWLKSFPVRALIKAGQLVERATPVEQLQEVLSFFGVASIEAWSDVWRTPRAAAEFRATATSEAGFGAIAAWLRGAELRARAVQASPYSPERFKQALRTIRDALDQPFETALATAHTECAAAGVALVLNPELPGMQVSGATRWLSPEKALVALTLRYKSDDQFWFTLFHEAAHILLHQKRTVFLEAHGERAADDETQEREANRFAREFLIPQPAYMRLLATWPLSETVIRSFAKEQRLPAGIVLARLQHDKALPWASPLNRRLKQRLSWAP